MTRALSAAIPNGMVMPPTADTRPTASRSGAAAGSARYASPNMTHEVRIAGMRGTRCTTAGATSDPVTVATP
ncbi:hypothetical protein GCM10010102_28870 [Promicromonospora citrea]|uniref:Uncharacterized protein n=1 Tax=Promicromonospora citrea TaxID=43677 RepID=A0A8H9L5J0_9MICO|nr:hypothetical protein GCM10010102_28870 [Promicromonospora citrea]